MLIREAGILINKVPILFTNNHKVNKDESDLIFTSELMNGLLIFTECLMAPIEYFENDKYTIIIKKGKIHDYYGKIQEVAVFLIVDKNKKLEKYLYKKIIFQNILLLFFLNQSLYVLRTVQIHLKDIKLTCTAVHSR